MTPRMLGRVAAALVLAFAAPALAKTAADHNTEGVAYYEQQNWRAAINAFNEAYELAPENEVVRRNLCNAYQSLANDLAAEADFERAVRFLQHAIGVDPTNPSPLIQLGSYYIRLQYDTEAIHRLEEALDLEPDNIDARELLGDAYYQAGELTAALEAWSQVAAEATDRPGLEEKLAKARRELAVEGDFYETQSRNFSIRFDRGTPRADVSHIRNLLEQAFRDITRKFGNYPVPTPVQVIIYSEEDFRKATDLPDHVGGLYDGRIRIPIQLAVDGDELRDRLRVLVYHEFTHVVVRFLLDDNAPWWLNEGLAQAYSEAFTEADRAAFRRAYEAGQLFALADLEASQLDRLGPRELGVAYLQAHATARYLLDHFGQRHVVRMLEQLAAGADASRALTVAFRQNYMTLENAVARQYGTP
jgi:tetratricopeptide (TPR) repeat protein